MLISVCVSRAQMGPVSESMSEPPSQGTTAQVNEPGPGIPQDHEIFVAVRTAGHLDQARTLALEDVKFQARHKAMGYQIIETKEEKRHFSSLVKISYRLVPQNGKAEPSLWEGVWVKIETFRLHLFSIFREAEKWIRSKLGNKSPPFSGQGFYPPAEKDPMSRQALT